MSSEQSQKLYFTLFVKGNSFFNPLYVGAGVPCLPISTLALHKVPTLVCIAQHLLAKLGGNLAIFQWEEGHLVSNTDVVCATPCSVEVEDFSMHVLFSLGIWARN